MAPVPSKLTVIFSVESLRDIAEIWEWNASRRGERHANRDINFLRSETTKLAGNDSPGRMFSLDSTLRYHTIKRRSGGYGHVIIFWIDRDVFHVFRFFHTSQDWENKLDGTSRSEESAM